ncbi:hypothetical protein PX701_03050 [Agromyces sp. H3Y2-19a]|uniref:hypothetical protein n=1 Tax=Agromyces TaxID=33877 RepID=UPI001E313B4E|nr:MULTISPECIES: hypothetical protein [Agromyces]MCD5346222.1 hypothetical protein [Agromyces sp. S2-1-8]MDF0512589.1 hypothetical protein [Agromyces chromiiresistens]
MSEPQELPMHAASTEVRRVRSRGQIIAALVMVAAGAICLVLSFVMYDALVEVSSDMQGRRSGLRTFVAPGAVLLSAAALVCGLIWLFAWSYRWERVATGTKLKQRVNTYLAVAPQDAGALLERVRTGDPRVYLPLPVAKHGNVVLATWLAPADSVAYVAVTAKVGREWQPLPLVTLSGNAYNAISLVTADQYGSRASQTIVNGFLDPFLRD